MINDSWEKRQCDLRKDKSCVGGGVECCPMLEVAGGEWVERKWDRKKMNEKNKHRVS